MTRQPLYSNLDYIAGWNHVITKLGKGDLVTRPIFAESLFEFAQRLALAYSHQEYRQGMLDAISNLAK